MTALIVLGIVLLLLVLLARMRVGVRARYDAAGPVIRIRVGFLRLKVYPRTPGKKKKKKEKKPPKEKTPKGPEDAPKKGGGLQGLLDLLPIITRTLGRFRRKLRIDRLTLHLTVPGAEDPAKAALTYGRGSAVMGTVLPVLENAFTLCHRDLRTEIDFNAEKMTVFAEAELTLAVWHGVYLAFSFLWPFLKLRRNNQTAATDTTTQAKQTTHESKSERSVSK